MKTGRVAVFTQYRGPMTFREYPLPDVGPEDMLVKLRLANICGSDLHFWKGKGPKMPSGFPQILGHEMVGNIVAIGKNVDTDSQGETLKQGDRITYTYFSPCRHCWMCLTGKPGCPNRYRHWLGVSSEDAPHFHGGVRRVLLHESRTFGVQGARRSARSSRLSRQLCLIPGDLWIVQDGSPPG